MAEFRRLGERLSRLPTPAVLAIVAGLGLLVIVGGLLALLLLRQARLSTLATPTPTPTAPVTDDSAAMEAASRTPRPDDPFYCDQPLIGPQPTRPAAASPEPGLPPPAVVESAPGRMAGSVAFLELPFPYDGGNQNFGGTDEQFRRANQRLVSGGRINSFFDHLYPIYPASSGFGREPAQHPIGDHLLLYDGALSDYDYYSGHPGYDYSPYVRRQPTTPLFAAADGVIDSVGEHSSGALFMRIRHQVPGVGSFRTTYWHLHPDAFFYAMLGTEGQAITAGTRIGTMGNTGWSTGHHLHFEVRFDRNQDGVFSADEVIDPYGFTPSAAYPEDPWGQAASFSDAYGATYNHAASPSYYLWLHPLGVSAQVPAEGGGQIDQPGDVGGAGPAVLPELCAPAGSLPPGGTVNYAWSPNPPPSSDLAGGGAGCVLSVFDAGGQPALAFDPPVAVQLPFDPADLADLDPATVAIFWQDAGSEAWRPLPTEFDYENNLAAAFADRPGRCALMGRPTRDLVAPQTRIQVTGPTSPEGDFYDAVTVTLSSEDPSGVALVEYSLDGGTSWQAYAGPFTLAPNGAPEPLTEGAGDAFGVGPGRFLVLASATDGAGNVEDPPVALGIIIDPSLGPTETPTRALPPTFTPTPSDTPTPTPTFTPAATPTPSATPTLTPTPTPTPVPIIEFWPDAILVTRRSCTRLHWRVEHVVAVHLYGGEFGQAPGIGLVGAGAQEVCPPFQVTTYVLRVDLGADRYLEREIAIQMSGNYEPYPPPVPEPLGPVDGIALDCGPSVAIKWMLVSDSAGIMRYEWRLEQSTGSADGPYNLFLSGRSEEVRVIVPVGCGRWYRWQVRALDGWGNASAYASLAYFSILGP